MRSIKTLLEDQILRVWGRGDTHLVDQNYAPNVNDHMPLPGQTFSLEALKKVVEDFRIAFPDLTMHLDGTLSAGPMGMDFWTLNGTHSGPLFGLEPTGKRVRFSGMDMVKVSSGKVTDLWHVEELGPMFTQVGAPMPPFKPAFDAPIAPVQTYLANAQDARNHALRDLAERHIVGIWAQCDPALARDMYTPDVKDMQPAPNQRPGVEGIIDVLLWLRKAVPDLEMHIQTYLIDPPYAADRWIMTGTHTGAPLFGIEPAGKTFWMNGMDVIHVTQEDRIDAVWHVEEMWQLAGQLKR
ncbi:MAG: ester cyclase family protein [Pseudomonadota bacterium]